MDKEPILNEHGFDIVWWYSRPVCPNIHMPRWASRILLECEEDARLERLQDITEEDAKAEGVRQLNDGSGTWVGREGNDREGRHLVTPWFTARQAFADLWQSLHSKPGERWEDNPEVVRVGRFRRIR